MMHLCPLIVRSFFFPVLLAKDMMATLASGCMHVYVKIDVTSINNP